MIIPVILAGGVGSRFWPLSRENKPKQFLNLVDAERSMIQCTVDRICKTAAMEDIFIVTNEKYHWEMKKQLPFVPSDNLLIEPVGRNTAACIGLAAIYIETRYQEDGVMIVLPSDHQIGNEEEFIRIINTAVEFADMTGDLVTIGIKPDYPETGYGYICYHAEGVNESGAKFYRVDEFTEKPDLENAQRFLDAGTYLWNSGMFIWKVSTIRNMIRQHMPELYQGLETIKESIGKADELKVLKEEYIKLASVSIDYGILEKAENIYVIPGNFGWDDIGSWPALERIVKRDSKGNVIQGKHIGIDTRNTIVHSKNKVITTVGIDDLVIVDTEDAILICDKKRAQEIKEIREMLAKSGYAGCL